MVLVLHPNAASTTAKAAADSVHVCQGTHQLPSDANM